MVTKSATKGRLDPKVFDFNSVMARTKAPKPKPVSTFLRPDLLTRIEELQELFDEADKKKADKSADGERSIGDPAPADGPAAELVDEYNALVDEFNDSELVFEFRATKLSDVTKARESMILDGHDLEKPDTQEIAISYMLASVCENAGWTGAQWHQWREQIGEAAFQPLLIAANAANNGLGVTAPFSRRPSPGLTTEK